MFASTFNEGEAFHPFSLVIRNGNWWGMGGGALQLYNSIGICFWLLRINTYVLVTSSFNMIHFHIFLTCFPLLMRFQSRFFVKLYRCRFQIAATFLPPKEKWRIKFITFDDRDRLPHIQWTMTSAILIISSIQWIYFANNKNITKVIWLFNKSNFIPVLSCTFNKKNKKLLILKYLHSNVVYLRCNILKSRETNP